MAGYIRACINAFMQSGSSNRVMLFRYPVNAEAPFVFGNAEALEEFDYSTEKQALYTVTEKFNPDVILCSGWGNADYLEVVKRFAGKIPVVLCFDNQWQGTLKQYLAGIYSRFALLGKFSHAWVPGKAQSKFATHLGFDKNKIFTGFYAADVSLFNTIYDQGSSAKRQKFPKVLISVARYIPAKGLPLLWQAYAELHKEGIAGDWQLWCFGQGQEYEQRMQYPGITHFGFVQPDDMKPYLMQSGVFVLPSIYEPWGVAVHEMAAAGFPLILSDRVGAGTAFLEESKNGFLFESGSVAALKKALSAVMTASDETLMTMAEHSHHLAQNITPQTWSHTLQSLKMINTSPSH